MPPPPFPWEEYAENGGGAHHRQGPPAHPGSPRAHFPHSPRTSYMPPPHPAVMPPRSPRMAPHSPRMKYALTDHGIVSAGEMLPLTDVVIHPLPIHLGSPRILSPRLTFVDQGPIPISTIAQIAAAATSHALSKHGFGFELPQPAFAVPVPVNPTILEMEPNHGIPLGSGFHVNPINPAAVPEILLSAAESSWVQPRSPSPALAFMPPGTVSTSPGIYDGRAAGQRSAVIFY
jgi:hypothetical protein